MLSLNRPFKVRVCHMPGRHPNAGTGLNATSHCQHFHASLFVTGVGHWPSGYSLYGLLIKAVAGVLQRKEENRLGLFSHWPGAVKAWCLEAAPTFGTPPGMSFWQEIVVSMTLHT